MCVFIIVKKKQIMIKKKCCLVFDVGKKRICTLRHIGSNIGLSSSKLTIKC